MLEERVLSRVVRGFMDGFLELGPCEERDIPGPQPGKRYMLYLHVPFCERLCPYCSFNRFPFDEDRALPYFDNLRREMRMLAEKGYDFESLYIGGGTPTVVIDELCRTIDEAHSLFGSLAEVSSETNPNHLIPAYLEKLDGRVQRLSVGVQSFNNDLLHQMGRLEKYGDNETIFQRIQEAVPHFQSMNVDMIFNFPAQTEQMLIDDLAWIVESGATQTTFYPLMASPSVEKSLAETVGAVDYAREARFYDIIWRVLSQYGYDMSSAWTFDKSAGGMIDEYVVNYEEYPALGSGGITYLDGSLYVNTFSVTEYNELVPKGVLSVRDVQHFSKANIMRYRFMMQLFGLRLDKAQFEADFGVPIELGLPAEMAFMSAAGAFDVNDSEQITLTPKGRYLLVAMMRQFFIGVNNLRDQARAQLNGAERQLIFDAIEQPCAPVAEIKPGFAPMNA